MPAVTLPRKRTTTGPAAPARSYAWERGADGLYAIRDLELFDPHVAMGDVWNDQRVADLCAKTIEQFAIGKLVKNHTGEYSDGGVQVGSTGNYVCRQVQVPVLDDQGDLSFGPDGQPKSRTITRMFGDFFAIEPEMFRDIALGRFVDRSVELRPELGKEGDWTAPLAAVDAVALAGSARQYFNFPKLRVELAAEELAQLDADVAKRAPLAARTLPAFTPYRTLARNGKRTMPDKPPAIASPEDQNKPDIRALYAEAMRALNAFGEAAFPAGPIDDTQGEGDADPAVDPDEQRTGDGPKPGEGPEPAQKQGEADEPGKGDQRTGDSDSTDEDEEDMPDDKKTGGAAKRTIPANGTAARLATLERQLHQEREDNAREKFTARFDQLAAEGRVRYSETRRAAIIDSVMSAKPADRETRFAGLVDGDGPSLAADFTEPARARTRAETASPEEQRLYAGKSVAQRRTLDDARRRFTQARGQGPLFARFKTDLEYAARVLEHAAQG
jgi:hypothetical protein